ncbi:MAG: class I SAM-dependent methyltransferase [Thermoplasmata archaeon]|nr:class I SAM-dependent methyltransferase [Thermoplasmata archaeon]
MCALHDSIRKISDLARVVVRNPRHLRLGLRAVYDSFEDADKRRHVIGTYGFEKGLRTVCILDILPNLDESVDPYSFLYGMSPPLDIALLKGLARQYKDCAYLEIGSWRGESLANVASVAKKCVSVSLPPDEMRSFGATENEVLTSNFFSKSLGNVEHIAHNSHTLDFTPYHGKFDLVFIDGDHSYNGVRLDTINAHKLLRNDDSIIVWHDYGKTPETVNWAVFAAILDGSPADRRERIYRVSNTLCAIYTKKKLNASHEEFAGLPKRRFAVRINGKRTG